MQPIIRKPNETDLDFHKRVVYGKLVDKTMADYDYTELANAIYGKEYSSDVARRMLYGSRKTLELLDKSTIENISDQTVLDDIEEKILELKKEKQKLSDQRRELSRVIRNDSRYEHIQAMFENAANNLDNSIGRLFPEYPTKDNWEDNWEENEAVVVFSDWHYGMKTDNIYNSFNTMICRERVANVTNAMIKKLQLHKCSALHVIVLGDLCHGAIHTSARVASEELVCDQLMQSAELLAQSIAELSKYVPHTNVYTTFGNHARTVANKKDNIHNDNMERLIEWWLIERFKGSEDRISIIESDTDEIITANVCGHDICASHGDIDSLRSSPRLLATLLNKKRDMNIEYIILGDKHHSESFNELGITSIICGSLCGTDEYANNKRLYSDPEQLMIIFNYYGSDAVYRLKCDINYKYNS